MLIADHRGRIDGAARRPRSRTIVVPTAPSSLSGFFQYDKRAHMQIDGKAVTLMKRLALSGARYSGGGVTLTDGEIRGHAEASASGR